MRAASTRTRGAVTASSAVCSRRGSAPRLELVLLQVVAELVVGEAERGGGWGERAGAPGTGTATPCHLFVPLHCELSWTSIAS
jgi:hypothetical protein